MKNAIKENQIIITGTGWNYKEYFKSWNLAKKYKKIIISFIDHWKNYKLDLNLKRNIFFHKRSGFQIFMRKKKQKKFLQNLK